MQTLSSLVALEVVTMTISGATSDNKVSFKTMSQTVVATPTKRIYSHSLSKSRRPIWMMVNDKWKCLRNHS